jgi:hypothetical protein
MDQVPAAKAEPRTMLNTKNDTQSQSSFEPVAERIRDKVPSEKSAAERQKLRQKALLETLMRARTPFLDDGPPPVRTFQEGLIVVIATYNDGKPLFDPFARINTIHHLLLALEHQRSAMSERARNNFKIVVADNGLSEPQRSRLSGYFISLAAQAEANGRTAPECILVDAPKIRGDDFTRTAGYARNMALKEIQRRKKAGDPSFDAPILIHDDDAVTHRIGDMYKLLSRNRNVVGAVAPCVQGVREMARYATEIRAHEYKPRRGSSPQSSSFPSVFDKDGFLNFNVLFAFGGSRIPKTCSLLLHPRAIDDLTSDLGEVFHVWRKGSFEDMCCSIGLACSNWDIYECDIARAYDQVRSNQEARLRQQFGWAYDHATAFFDFSEVSKLLPSPVVHPGVSVLVPLTKEERTPTEGWVLQSFSQLTGFPGLQASIVRPEEVRETLLFVREQLAAGRMAEAFEEKHAYAIEGCFETRDNVLATVEVSLAVVGQVLAQTDKCRARTVEVPFVDHAKIYASSGDRGKHADALRYDRDTRVARLLGNLGSMFRSPANDFANGRVGYVVFGPRQAT